MARLPNPTMEAAVAILSKNNNADFATVKAKLAAKGLNLIPIVFGRAKSLLGIAKPAGSAPKARAPKGPAAALQAAQGRRARAAAPVESNGHTSVGQLQALLQQRDGLNARIQQIEAVLSAD